MNIKDLKEIVVVDTNVFINIEKLKSTNIDRSAIFKAFDTDHVIFKLCKIFIRFQKYKSILLKICSVKICSLTFSTSE